MSRTLRALLAATLLLAASGASAATISAVASSHVDQPGEAYIDISLDLAPGEQASIFEGRFDLIGVGSVVQTPGPGNVLAGGPTWDTAFGNIVTSQLVLSLTILGVAEAIHLARKAGVDPAKVGSALLGGFAQSRVL